MPTTSTTCAPTRASSSPGARLPDTGADLYLQPIISRWENAPSLHKVIGVMPGRVGGYYASYKMPPKAITLDIDDAV